MTLPSIRWGTGSGSPITATDLKYRIGRESFRYEMTSNGDSSPDWRARSRFRVCPRSWLQFSAILSVVLVNSCVTVVTTTDRVVVNGIEQSSTTFQGDGANMSGPLDS